MMNRFFLRHPNIINGLGSVGILGSIAAIGAGVFAILAGLGMAPFTIGISAPAGIGLGIALIGGGAVGLGLSIGALIVEHKKASKIDNLLEEAFRMLSKEYNEKSNRYIVPPSEEVVERAIKNHKEYTQDIKDRVEGRNYTCFSE